MRWFVYGDAVYVRAGLDFRKGNHLINRTRTLA